MIALTFGLAIDIVAMIAMPVFYANTEAKPVTHTGPIDHPDQSDIAIPSVVDQLDTQKLSLGITLIIVYAGVTIYLVSPRSGVTSR